jgi:hypothetical protein
MTKKKPLPEDVLNYFRAQGSRGGTIGNQSMTAAQKKARALKASHAAAVVRTAKAKAKKAKH